MGFLVFRSLLGFFLLLGLFSCGGGAASTSNSNPTPYPSPSPVSAPSPSPRFSSLSEHLDHYLAERQPLNAAGAGVLVMKEGVVEYKAGRGLANAARATSIGENTGFRLASVSKAFTAFALMQLVENGQVQLDASMLTYLPDMDASWSGITVRMLLTHKSGIFDLLNDMWDPALLNGMNNDAARRYFIAHPSLKFSPGSRDSYSNTAYVLLAEIIERASGQSFPAYMNSHIFAVAGMGDSYINDDTHPLRAGDALNYANRQTYFGITTQLSGNMAQVSSIADFEQFFQALHAGLIVSEETLHAMTQPQSTVFGVAYGLGLMLGDNSFGHAGSWDGFQTEMTIDRSAKLDIVVLSNGGAATRSLLGGVKAEVYAFYANPR